MARARRGQHADPAAHRAVREFPQGAGPPLRAARLVLADPSPEAGDPLTWQIWNEPNETSLWPTQPFAKSYVALLRRPRQRSSRPIRAPRSCSPASRARPGSPTWIRSTRSRGSRRRSTSPPPSVHQAAGGRDHDHRKMRQVMNSLAIARTPLLADELGWPSSVGKTEDLFGFETTEAGQARNIAAVLPLLAGARKRLGDSDGGSRSTCTRGPRRSCRSRTAVVAAGSQHRRTRGVEGSASRSVAALLRYAGSRSAPRRRWSHAIVETAFALTRGLSRARGGNGPVGNAWRRLDHDSRAAITDRRRESWSSVHRAGPLTRSMCQRTVGRGGPPRAPSCGAVAPPPASAGPAATTGSG